MVLNLQSQGSGPWVVLSHALGCSLEMYTEVAADLARDHHVIAYDHRDHGASQMALRPYGIQDLADDAADLIRAKCGGGPVVFAGVSMGGMTAQALAARHPQLVRGVVVANSAQHYSAEAQAMWQSRIHTVHTQGMSAITDGAMLRWFSAEFRAAHPERVARARRVLEACDPAAYMRACAAVAALDARAGNAKVTCPALVISGDFDEATPPAMSDDIAAQLSQARSVQRVALPTAHLSAIEAPELFAAHIRQFTQQLS